MNETLKQKLVELLEPVVLAEGMELVDVSVSGGGRTTLRVTIDQERGIGVDDCARVSRAVSLILDVEDPFPGRYALEVSSPGLNRPLVKPEHFRRAVDRDVKLKLNRPLEGRRLNYRGRLTGIMDDPPRIVLEMESESVTIPLDCIGKANVEYPVEEALAGRRRR